MKKISYKKLNLGLLSKHRVILMGFLTLMIIIFHYGEDCKLAGYPYDLTPFNRIFQALIGSSGVDAFLIMSGISLYFSLAKRLSYNSAISNSAISGSPNANSPIANSPIANSPIADNASIPGANFVSGKLPLASFYKKRFSRILIPYLILSIVMWGTMTIIEMITAGQGFSLEYIWLFLGRITFVTFFTRKELVFWYILAIAICYLIYPLLFKLINTLKSTISEIVICILLMALFTLPSILLAGYDSVMYDRINVMTLRFAPFIAGAFLGKAVYEKRRLGTFFIIVMALAVVLAPFNNIPSILGQRYLRGYFLTAVMFLIMIIAEIFSDKDHIVTKILNWMGLNSLEIFLSHVALRTFMNSIGLNMYKPYWELLMLAAALVLTISVKRLTSAILKRS